MTAPANEPTDPAVARGDEELLAELAEEFSSRLRRGEHPQIEEYVAKYPTLGERISKLFPTIALIEKSRHVAGINANEQPGAFIGRYKLLERIGEGGFGTVFMAEQQHPVRRKVALKLIKAGFDTKQVIARFEAERQALALMDHENIARVLDAGATESGHPYFVMELVHGVPITDYCDKNQLSPKQRLELFIQVCRAVQHAHTKGIIHRDIKPTNVLVTLHDGVPVPKVIDFGVAKATGQQALAERTLFTQFAQMVGTPLYMSPEQAEMSGLDVDTRSDVYGLGVLLYELLTGTTPFDKDRLRQAANDEVRRIIREEEPPTPSTRISTLGDKLIAVSAHCKTDPKRLGPLVRGDLDWIVMKCLEKDRSRRYETASGLARDVECYLQDEPVEACPPSAVYRLRKYIRRHRASLAAAALVAVSLLVAVGGITAGVGWAIRDRAARDEQAIQERAARQARVSEQIELILDEVARLQQAEKWSEALVSARRAEPALATGEAIPDVQQRARQALADLELVRRLDETRAQSGAIWGPPLPPPGNLGVCANQEYLTAFREAGIDVDTLPAPEAAKRIAARGSIAAALLPAMDDWIAVRSALNDESATRHLIELLKAADPDPWRQHVRDALANQEWTLLEILAGSADLERQPAATLSFLSSALRANRKWRPEIAVLKRAQWKYPFDFWINLRLGTSLVWFRNPREINEGIGYLRAALAVRPQDDSAAVMLGNGYFFLREYGQAIAWYRIGIEMRGESLESSGWYCNLGTALAQAGEHEAAASAFERSIYLSPGNTIAYTEFAMVLSNHREEHLRDPARAVEMAGKAIQLSPSVGGGWSALGVARYRQDQWQEARDALTKSLELGGRPELTALRADADFVIVDRLFLAMSSWKLGQTDEARQWYEQANTAMAKIQPNTQELVGLRLEAANLLGLPPSATTRAQEAR